jgi:hypothetical protein
MIAFVGDGVLDVPLSPVSVPATTQGAVDFVEDKAGWDRGDKGFCVTGAGEVRAQKSTFFST